MREVSGLESILSAFQFVIPRKCANRSKKFEEIPHGLRQLPFGGDQRLQEIDVYNLIGEPGVAQLVAAFYRRVPGDDVLGPMYPPEDLVAAEQRLRDFLTYRLGGPQRYIEQRGHPRLRARHAPFQINQVARDRWMHLMNEAMAETGLPSEAEQFLRTFLEEMSTFLINHE
jgi:hemoglobin